MNGANPTGPVVVGVDGSPCGQAALQVAAGLAVALGAELVAVHCVGLTTRLSGEIVPANQHLDELNAQLHGEWTALLAGYPQLSWQAELVWGAPPEVLTDLAEQREASFVVVGSRGHTTTALLGSTSHHVVHHCRRPVVVVPQREKEN